MIVKRGAVFIVLQTYPLQLPRHSIPGSVTQHLNNWTGAYFPQKKWDFPLGGYGKFCYKPKWLIGYVYFAAA